MNDRKTFIRDVYSKYWLNARERKYGFLKYDKNLCDLIQNRLDALCNDKRAKILEVAIGTGYPFAQYFYNKGCEVHGVDISPLLVKKCRASYPHIKAITGDAEDLKYAEELFDVTYCFHSTWYFVDFKKAVHEMLRVTRGLVIFDIQNRNNFYIEKEYKKRVKELYGIGYMFQCIKNIAKLLTRKGYPLWVSVNYDIPAFSQDVFKYIEESGYRADCVVFAKECSGDLKEVHDKSLLFKKYERLVYVVDKHVNQEEKMKE